MKWIEIVDALVRQPPHREVVVRFLELDKYGSHVDWKGSIPIVEIASDGRGNTVIYLQRPIPRPPTWTSIPPECPAPLARLIADKTLVSPKQMASIWQMVLDHFNFVDDVPF